MNIFVSTLALLTGLVGAYLAKPPDNRFDYEEKSSSKESAKIGQLGSSLTAQESIRTRDSGFYGLLVQCKVLRALP